MNAKQALELLLPIPKENFITGKFTDEESCCCAVGHLVRLSSDDPSDYSRENCNDTYNLTDVSHVRDKSEFFLKEKYKISNADMATVNNYDGINGYNEDNPKDRVIHLLNDMIEAGH